MNTALSKQSLRRLPSFLACLLAFAWISTPVFTDPEAAPNSETYRAGKAALDEERWGEAAALFKRAATEEGVPADAALYWQGYALEKQGRASAALATLGQLRPERFPASRWLDDARALEIEIRGAKGETLSPEAQSEAELKLIALFGLMEQNPDRALTYIQQMLSGSEPHAVKEKALFVLAQSDAPEARRLLVQMAKGETHGALRQQAIYFLGVEADNDPSIMELLDQIYRDSEDLEVKRHVLHAYLVAERKESLLAVARGTDAPELRAAAVHGLGAMGAVDVLRELYAAEESREVKVQVLQSLFVADDVESLIRVARTETDPELKGHAIYNLGLVDGEESLAALGELYRNSADSMSRRKVIEAYFLQDAAGELVKIARKEKDLELRKAAVEALTRMDAPEVEEFLLEILEN